MSNPFYQDVEISKSCFESPVEEDKDIFVDQDGKDEKKEVKCEEEESDEEDESKNNPVKKYQAQQDSNTCIIPMDLEAQVVVNNSSKTIFKNIDEDGKSIAIAPGEGKIPTNYLREEHFDVKSFPKHHPSGKYGLNHPRKFKLTPQMFFNQRLMNVDERFAQDPIYVFMVASFLERLGIEKQINISGMKGVSTTQPNGEKAVKLKDAFDVFKKIKGTPKYWQVARNELIAKVKQLGPFHIFFTFSCGEMRWAEMYLNVFKRKGLKIDYPGEDWNGDEDLILVEGKPLWEFVREMQKSSHELFKDYHFLITRAFDARVRSFVNNILMGKGRGKIPLSHYSYRVEFQARGNPQ